MITLFSKLTGFALNVATIAALSAADAGHLEDGAIGWTGDVRDQWVLAKNALAGTAADGISVIAATGAGASAFWFRIGISDPYWAYQTTWYVDPVAGLDTNTGASNVTALKTVAEFCRRLRFSSPNTAYTVNILNDVPNTDLCNPLLRSVNITGQSNVTYGTSITFKGQRTVVRSGTTAAGTTQTDPSTAAATAQAEIVDAAVAWNADAGRLIVLNDGRQAWVLSGKTNVVGAAGRVTDWISSSFSFAAGNPGAGLAYNVVTLTKFRAQVQQFPGTQQTVTGGFPLIFQDLEFDDVGVQQRPFCGQVNFRLLSSKLSNTTGGSSINLSFGMTGGFYGLTGTLFENISASLATVSLASIANIRNTIFVGNGCRRARIQNGFALTNSVNGMCIQGGWFQVSSSTGETPAGNCIIGSAGNGLWLGVYDDFDLPAGSGITDLVLVFQTAGCSIQGSVYGVGDGVTAINGLRADVGAQVKIRASLNEPGGGATSTTAFNLQPSGAGLQMSLNNAATTMPNLNASAGAVLPALAAYTTFAQYKAAPFNRQAVNWSNLCAFIGF